VRAEKSPQLRHKTSQLQHRHANGFNLGRQKVDIPYILPPALKTPLPATATDDRPVKDIMPIEKDMEAKQKQGRRKKTNLTARSFLMTTRRT